MQIDKFQLKSDPSTIDHPTHNGGSPTREAYQLRSDLPTMVKILDVIEETPEFKTFLFSYPGACRPGQFLLIWLPRVDEKPFTLSYKKDGVLGITAQLRGKFTKALFNLKKGDSFGVRGGYGAGYNLDGRGGYGAGYAVDVCESCVITGGSGTATVLPLLDELQNPNLIIGARNKDSLLYVDKLPNALFTTDDGSYGFHGTVVDAFNDLLSKKRINAVYVCGPEKMMAAVIKICQRRDIDCQFAMERYMKCGIGVCGICVCGGKRVCVDGPIFSLKDLPNLTEFSSIFRTKSGKPEYY